MQKKLVRRTWAVEQGWNELAAFYIDRAMKWFKKPPTTGRFITNKELYANDNRLYSTLKRWLPTYQIPVCLISWYDGIRVKPPGFELRDMMTHSVKLDLKRVEEIAQISDVMVFDFLVDDHDRIEAHNWIKDKSGSYIFWDSGLSFRHGPHGRLDKDLDIFCGRREWAEGPKLKSPNSTCERTCMFRNSTIEMLKTLGHKGFHRLGSYTWYLIQKDPLHPVFEYGLFLPNRGELFKVKYRSEDFLEGLNIRVKQIIKYAEDCSATFGPSSVLLPDTSTRLHSYFLSQPKI